MIRVQPGASARASYQRSTSGGACHQASWLPAYQYRRTEVVCPKSHGIAEMSGILPPSWRLAMSSIYVGCGLDWQ